jgi:hypothetical protein
MFYIEKDIMKRLVKENRKEERAKRERNIIIYIIYLNCKWVFTRWQWCNTAIRRNTQNNTPHSNNKEHTTHNEYNYN